MFQFPSPEQQIDFSFALIKARGLYLQEALGLAVEELDIADLDKELARLAPKHCLSVLAKHGLRGELAFATPVVLRANPQLLAYYRLLLGYSQTEFFTKATGASVLKCMETEGRLPPKLDGELDDLCKTLNGVACQLIEGVGPERISKHLLDDLSLLTFGPQLRGGANVRKGDAAIVKIFGLIHAIVKKAVKSTEANRIEIRNAARRTVLIEFAADPDIIIREQMSDGVFRNIIAVEIKGGTDFSNIHNRIGEAEKSHQKARSSGYTECWTIVNVGRLDMPMAHKESPSTDKFYLLGNLLDTKSGEYRDFKNRIISLTGIKG